MDWSTKQFGLLVQAVCVVSLWLFNNVHGWSSENETSDMETKDERSYYRLKAVESKMVFVDGRACYR